MIARLRGKIVEKEARSLIVDVQGVGYRVAVLETLSRQVTVGEEIDLMTHHHVAGDDESLFGFKDKEHLRFFNLLLFVPSVGVKTAMGILEIASPATLAQAVAEGDVKLLTKVSGVGKKTAQRILIELKGKIEAPERTQAAGLVQEEAIGALKSIGYTAADARIAVAALPAGVETVEEAVRLVLREKEKVR